MVGPEGPLFVLFGSSIVQLSYSNGGWGAIFSDIYARKDIMAGIPDVLSKSLIRFFQSMIWLLWQDATVQPSLVIVYFGGNDSMRPHSSGLGPHVPLPEYIENMRKIAIHLKNLSDKTRIIFLSCPPVNEAKLRENTRDGIHVSAQGRKVVVEEILKVLKQAEWEPSLHWKSIPTEFSEDSPMI